MKKIVILGGSHSETPLIQEAKKRGLYVITIGNILGNGHLLADEYHLIDYTLKDEILNFCIKNSIDYISYGANDLSLFTFAYISEKLNLNDFDSFNTTIDLHYKDRFKKIARVNGIKTTKSLSFDRYTPVIVDELKFPLIIKPVDLGGGKGITLIYSKDELNSAVEKAFNFSQAKKIIIEEYFEGKLHSLSTFIRDKKVVFYYADDEILCKKNLFGVCASITPAEDFIKIEKDILKEVEKIAKVFDLKDGLLHIQYLQNRDEFSIIECTRRLPGDLYNIPVELSTGFEYSKTIIDFVTNNNIDIKQKFPNRIISRYGVEDSYPKEFNSFLIDKIELHNANKKAILIMEFDSKEQFYRVIQ